MVALHGHNRVPGISYQFYQKLEPGCYSTKTRVHSSLKPFFTDDSLLKHHYDSLMNMEMTVKPHSWAIKSFLLNIDRFKNPDQHFMQNLLPDLI